MVLTREGARRAIFPLAAATAFALRGAHGPWNNFNRQDYIRKTLLAVGSAGSSMAYGAYNAYKGLRRYFGSRKRRVRSAQMYGRRRYLRPKRLRRGRVMRRMKKRFVAGVGTYQKKMGAKFLKPFNSNFARNNFDSCRDFALNWQVLAPSAASAAQFELNFKIGNIPIALDKLGDYSEYKITNIQLVITPLKFGSGVETLTMFQEPAYMYIIPRHDTGAVSTLTFEEIHKSPGVIKVHLLKRRNTIINLQDYCPKLQRYIQTNNDTVTVPRDYQKLGWIENPTQAGEAYNPNSHPEYGRCVAWFPQINAGYQPTFRVQYCATILYRGYRSFIVDI